MKQILLYLLAIIGCFGCNNDDIKIDHSYDNISGIQEYQLPDNLAAGEVLANSELDIENEEIVFITKESEFRDAFSNYPKILPINFSKNKLLLVQGNCSKIGHINKQLTPISGQKYDLTIEIALTPFSPAITYAWAIGYVIPNSLEIEDISLIIDYKEYSGE